jgi:hypothetical protein
MEDQNGSNEPNETGSVMGIVTPNISKLGQIIVGKLITLSRLDEEGQAVDRTGRHRQSFCPVFSDSVHYWGINGLEESIREVPNRITEEMNSL